MKTLAKLLLFAVLFFGLVQVVMATQHSDTQTVTITFSEIYELGVSGDPGTLVIDVPLVPGDLPEDETDATTTMAWTSNVDSGKTRKITGQLNGLFSGVDLYATVAAPGSAGGTSAGEVKLIAVSAGDYVTGIGNCHTSGNTITYRADVPTEMVAPYTDTTHDVTWTLTDDV
jgi:hypothetical protein